MKKPRLAVVLVFSVLAAALALLPALFVRPWEPFMLLPGAITLALGIFFAAFGVRSWAGPVERYGIVTTTGRSSGELLVDAPVDQVRDALVPAVASINKFRLETPDTGQILVHSPWSTFSWGEVITVNLLPDASRASTRIVGRTEPRVRTNVLNFGQGATDLGLVFEAIERCLSADAAGRR